MSRTGYSGRADVCWHRLPSPSPQLCAVGEGTSRCVVSIKITQTRQSVGSDLLAPDRLRASHDALDLVGQPVAHGE